MKFDYVKMKLEKIPCNLCGQDNFFVLEKTTSNNLNATTCLCKNCGLIYISPRMTKQGYDEYYKHLYREDRKVAKDGHDEGGDLNDNFKRTKKYGNALTRKLAKYISRKGLILDVGSSTGGVLAGMKEVLPELEVLGIEPSVEESKFANDKGISTINALFEDFKTDKRKPMQFSNIICVRSLNHLLDPRSFFIWCFNNLKPRSHLILEVKNFRYQCRRAGTVAAGVQIDHPFMFIPETLKLFLENIGFKIVYIDDDEHKKLNDIRKQKSEGLSIHHIRIIGEKPKEVGEIKNNFKKAVYKKTKFQLSQPYLKLYHFGIYSKRFSFLRLRSIKDWIYDIRN